MFDSSWPRAVRADGLSACSNLRDVQGRVEDAIAVFEAQRELAVALDDKRLLVTTLVNLEQSVAALGRLEESVAHGRELTALMRREPSLRSVNESFVLKNLYTSLVRLGQLDEALDKVGRGWEMLEPSALASAKRHRFNDAARLLGRAGHLFEATDVVRDPVEQQLRDDLEILLQDALSGQELTRLMKAVKTLSDEAAVSIGLQAEESADVDQDGPSEAGS